MTKFLSTYLLVTGIGAFVALAMPGLVILGLYLLILPGLILGAMPTLFMYGIVFTAGWMGGRAYFGDGFLAIAAGIAAVIAFGYMIPKPTRMADMAAYRASILADVTPPRPIALHGDLLFELPHLNLNKQTDRAYPYVPGTRGYACNNYCIAALFTPGVTSVTLAQTDKPSPEARTYRLERRPGCHSNVDIDDSALVPPVTRTAKRGIDSYAAGKVIASARALQLGGDYCLVMGPALTRHDIIITERNVAGRSPKKWPFGPGRIDTETVEIRERGTLVYRNHQSTLTTLGAPLAMLPDGSPNTRFGWARDTIRSKKGYGSVELRRSLADHTNLDPSSEALVASAKEALIPAYRRQLSSALDDPAISAEGVEFKVMEAYLTAIGKDPAPEDLAILERLFGDKRFTRYPGAWALFLTATQMQPIYDAYTKRLIEQGAAPESSRTMVGHAVGNMGAASIELIGPLQQQLLADPLKRTAVPELARAMGHGDPENAVRLLAMLRQTAAILAEIHEQRRARTIDGYGRQEEREGLVTLIGHIKGGLCLMGPKASVIRDDLDTYLMSGAMPPNLVDGHAMSDWQVILVRMGKPIGDVQKPQNLGGSVSNYRDKIQRKVDRWKPEDC
ncbi:hypothetical protein ABC347_00185 [Sphingomonas sp. 1P06PA]|uniref:hypothetical protein n=1 Tax=Sphingomonas sp. 1P06PA TaxID=554121 RepID=UPI0039A5B12A